jgi:hypothetical protein
MCFFIFIIHQMKTHLVLEVFTSTYQPQLLCTKNLIAKVYSTNEERSASFKSNEANASAETYFMSSSFARRVQAERQALCCRA